MKNTILVESIDVSEDILFDDLNKVINYLTSIKNTYKNGEQVYLDQSWTGYENNFFTIEVTRLETDTEYKARLEQEDLEFKKAEEKRKKDSAEQKRKEGIKEQIKNLEKQL